MKNVNLSLALTALFGIGLIALYVLYFTGKQANTDNQTTIKSAVPTAVSSGSGTIAFVDTDEILEKYELVQKLSDQLDRERRKKDADFTMRQEEYEEEAAYFQESVQNLAHLLGTFPLFRCHGHR